MRSHRLQMFFFFVTSSGEKLALCMGSLEERVRSTRVHPSGLFRRNNVLRLSKPSLLSDPSAREVVTRKSPGTVAASLCTGCKYWTFLISTNLASVTKHASAD